MCCASAAPFSQQPFGLQKNPVAVFSLKWIHGNWRILTPLSVYCWYDATLKSNPPSVWDLNFEEFTRDFDQLFLEGWSDQSKQDQIDDWCFIDVFVSSHSKNWSKIIFNSNSGVFQWTTIDAEEVVAENFPWKCEECFRLVRFLSSSALSSLSLYDAVIPLKALKTVKVTANQWVIADLVALDEAHKT